MPYNLLLLAGILLFVVGFFGFNSALNIQIDDTYLIFPLTFLIWSVAVLLLTFWLIYLVTKKILYSRVLTWIHIFLTIIGCVFILTLPYLLENSYEGLAGRPRRYYDIGQSKTYNLFGNLTKTALVISYFLALGQLTFLLNLIIGIFKRSKEKTTANTNFT